jgi:hypothetical protein
VCFVCVFSLSLTLSLSVVLSLFLSFSLSPALQRHSMCDTTPTLPLLPFPKKFTLSLSHTHTHKHTCSLLVTSRLLCSLISLFV